MRSQPKSKFVADISTTIKVIWLTNWILAASAWAGEWPCWRGPRGDGVSGETNVPVRWSSTENVAWKVPILNCDQDAAACIVAFDMATGIERWRTDRPNRTRSYCTPTIFQAAGKPQMVLSGSKCVASYDPDTGKQHWLVDGPTDQFVAGIVFTDDIFFVTGGFPDLHIIAIRPDGAGNVTDTHIAWRDTQGVSYVPSPIAHGKYFFVVADRGLTT